MREEDLGLILIFLTWIIPVIYIGYFISQGMGFGSYSLIQKIGKDPILFTIDLILFYIGLISVARGLRDNREEIRGFLNYLYIFPIINVLISALYSSSCYGFPEGMKIFTDGMFISMYNLLILGTLLLIDLNIKMKISTFPLREKGLLAVLAEFIAFGFLRYFYGPSFILMTVFLIIIPLTIFLLYK